MVAARSLAALQYDDGGGGGGASGIAGGCVEQSVAALTRFASGTELIDDEADSGLEGIAVERVAAPVEGGIRGFLSLGGLEDREDFADDIDQLSGLLVCRDARGFD